MNKVVKFCFLFMTITISMLAGTYSGGSGTSGDPYLISDLDDLVELSSISSDWNKYFKQTANITLSGSWTPIGSSSINFSGSYNGQGYTISGTYINDISTSGYWGFFGYTSGATIQNLGFTNVNITAKSNVGGLAGYCYNTTISGCYSTGTIIGRYDYIGGLIGECSAATINDCYSSGSVTGGQAGSGSYHGGLVGKTADASSIYNCYHSTGDVYGREYTGGLIGGNHSSSNVTRCYTTGNVYGNSDVGGLVGYSGYNISNSYSRGNASGSDNVGGLVGRHNTGGISNCYSTGVPGATTDKGGLVGLTEGAGTVTNSFWDKTTSGIETSSGGTGKTTTEMKTLSTFTDASWDFEGETTNGTDNYWDLSGSINDGYPYLSWQDGEDVSLPVELTSFTAEIQGSNVILKWSTESEIENLGFVIEKQIKGTNIWTEVASYVNTPCLEGHGSTTAKHDYQYTDRQIQPGMTYDYRLGDVDYSGKLTWHKSVEVITKSGFIQIASEFGLHKAYPNPFNPSVTLTYTLIDVNQTTLNVYNLRGQLVETLVNAYQQKGLYNFTWQPKDLSAGVYIVRLSSGNQTHLQKVVFVK